MTDTVTGKVTAIVSTLFACALTVSACGSSAGPDADGTPSAQASGPTTTAPGGPTPSAAPSPQAPEAGTGQGDASAAEGAGAGTGAPEGGGTPGRAAEVPVAADRARTAVEPLDAGPVSVAEESSEDAVSVELAGIRRTEAEASMPGEIAGSAIRVDVSVTHAGVSHHDLSASVVNLYYGADRTPAGLLSGAGAQALPGSVAPGEKATGTYVFGVPSGEIGTVLIEIDVDPDLHVALFEGEVP